MLKVAGALSKEPRVTFFLRTFAAKKLGSDKHEAHSGRAKGPPCDNAYLSLEDRRPLHSLGERGKLVTRVYRKVEMQDVTLLMHLPS